MKSRPLRQRRGCDWDDFGETITLVLVRASARETAEELAALVGGAVEPIDPRRPPEAHPAYNDVVFRPAGHPWSVALPGTSDSDIARKLSAALQTEAIALLHEDTGGWTEYRLFDSGENVERYTWGMDYSGEFADAAEELGEDAPPALMPTDGGKPWDHRIKRDDHEFLFRSDRRKVDPSLLHQCEAVLDAAFKAADAWLPGWAHFPWVDPSEHPDEPPAEEAFVVRG